MNTAPLHPADAFTLPRPARHVHLYLAAVDGVIVAPEVNRRPAACMRTGTSALPSDNLGRRVSLNNPDTGKTVTVYDTASNVIQKITANLAASGKAITYDYDYKRLTAIHYPDYKGNDVTYEYGTAGLSNGLNQIGRLTKVTDASGHAERAYGKLGETIKEVRTIASHTQGNSANSPEVYTTQYKYDTWLNRRSQRRSVNWARFGEVLKTWFPPVRIKHNLYPEPLWMTQAGSRMV